MVICLLYVYSKKYNHAGNHFVRMIPSHIVHSMRILNIGYNSYYIAGVTDRWIYLGNTTAPAILLKLNYQLTDTQVIRLQLPDTKAKRNKGLFLNIDSPFIYLTDHEQKWYYRRFSDSSFVDRNFLSQNIYTSVPISHNSVIVKKYDTLLHQNILQKESIYPTQIISAPDILKKQIDGIFCTDGLLNYNHENGMLLYLYYYRNEYIMMDSNLVIKRTGRTIDTTTHARIKVQQVSANRTMLSAPPFLVNRAFSTDGPYLFICSPQMAENETARIFKMGDVIDMYNLTENRYLKSFYLPHYKNQPLHDFKVRGHNVISLNGNYILTFNLLW
jgi:hypothetical protein